MCGIAGLFAKSPEAERALGGSLAAMVDQLAARGPDSYGIALYREPVPACSLKLSLLDPSGGRDWGRLVRAMAGELAAPALLADRGDQALVCVQEEPEAVHAWLERHEPGLFLLSAGRTIETLKRIGSPRGIAEEPWPSRVGGSHGLGHTRMATESRVSVEHAHPFSVGLDLCLVHNGSLSNHNALRRMLRRRGLRFQTDNDSEVAAAYIAWRLEEGQDLHGALESALADLDGFYTFAVGTREGFAVLRDPIACKPAVMAETTEWVAIASEHRAIAVLPGAEEAEVWEPHAARVYSWSREGVRSREGVGLREGVGSREGVPA